MDKVRTELTSAHEISARILHEFAWMVDHGRAGEAISLFAEDARMVFGEGSPKPGTISGAAEIRSFLESRAKQTEIVSRHVMSNIRAVAEGEGRIRVNAVLTLYRSARTTRPPEPLMIADVDDVHCQGSDQVWRIVERTVSPVFVHPTE